MLRIRVKMGPSRNKEWTCCFGLHVQTATIIIGLWHLFLNILAISLLAIIWRNPHMMEDLENSYDYAVDLNAPALPTPLSKVDPPYAYRGHSLNYQNFDMGGLVCICIIAITLMMIYGAIKDKPSHLLPFFCVQLFDFAITTLTATGYLFYLQSVHRLIAESHRLPWREKLLELSPDALMLVVLVAFLCIVFLKAYAIGIVWRCYKYLTLRQQNLRTLLPCVIPNLTGTNLITEERGYSTLLPNYDEAISQYVKLEPPPSYHAAMSNFPPEEDAAALAAGPTVHANSNIIPTNRRRNGERRVEVGVMGGGEAAENIKAVEPPPYNVIVVDLDNDEDVLEEVLESKRFRVNTNANDTATSGAADGIGNDKKA